MLSIHRRSSSHYFFLFHRSPPLLRKAGETRASKQREILFRAISLLGRKFKMGLIDQCESAHHVSLRVYGIV